MIRRVPLPLGTRKILVITCSGLFLEDRPLRSFAPVLGKDAATIQSGSGPSPKALDAFMKGHVEFREDSITIVMFG